MSIYYWSKFHFITSVLPKVSHKVGVVPSHSCLNTSLPNKGLTLLNQEKKKNRNEGKLKLEYVQNQQLFEDHFSFVLREPSSRFLSLLCNTVTLSIILVKVWHASIFVANGMTYWHMPYGSDFLFFPTFKRLLSNIWWKI